MQLAGMEEKPMNTIRKQPSLLKVLTDGEVEMVHSSSLKILSEVGVNMPNRVVLDLFADAGARVDRTSETVRIPPELVEEALEHLQKDFRFSPPDEGPLIARDSASLQLSMDTTPDIVEVITSTKRRGTSEDTLKGIAVANELDHVRLATAYCLPSEIDQRWADVHCYELLFTYSQKPVSAWIYSSESADYIIEMAQVIAGGEKELAERRLLSYFAEPISPLQYAPHTLEIILKLSQFQQPVFLGPMVTMGGSGPVTLAGTLSLHHAEILHGLVLLYLCSPDQPVIYSCHCHSMDLATMQVQYGAPEQALLACAAAQLAKRLGMFVCGNVMLNDSNTLDYMAGFQEAATASYALAAGWDMLGFMGFGTIGSIGSGVGHSLEKVIIQDECLSYLERMLTSFEVNQETLAYDEIREAGIGGDFFSREHTVTHMRDQVWRGKGMFTNSFYDAWSDSSAKTVAERAHERLKEILSRRLPAEPVLPRDIVKELQKISRRAKESAT